MKRLLPHILIALAVHAVVLRTDPDWLVEAPRHRVMSKSITLSISTGNHRDRAAPMAVSHEEPPESSPPKPAEASSQLPVAAPVAGQPADDKTLVPKPAAAAAKSKSSIKKPAAQKDVRKPDPKPPAAEPAALKPAATKSERPIEKLAPPKGRTPPAHKIPPEQTTPKPIPEKQAFPTRMTTPQAFNRQTTSPKIEDGSAAGSAGPEEPSNLVPSSAVAAVRDTPTTGSPQAGPIIKEAVPMYQINPPPKYPRRARRMGLEGRVMLEVLISAKGQVDDLRVLQSSGHKVLDRAALSAVRKWRFEPGTKDGKKNKMWVTIPIHFDLQ